MSKPYSADPASPAAPQTDAATCGWTPPAAPRHGPHGVAGWLRIVARGLPLGLTVFGGLVLLLTLRLVERPVCGARRPVTPWITQGVCRTGFAILGIRYRREGEALNGPGAVVANHASWLDIFALNAGKRVYFVSKSEVARWPGIGWLARATGTVFIRRDRREARAHVDLFCARLALGDRLLFFPEGTSTDGRRVLSFKPTLFAAFLTPPLRETLSLQPVSVIYAPAPGADPRFYGWWGDMPFGPHLLATLAARRQGTVTVLYHPPLRVAAYPDRKALARAAEDAVRSGLASAGVLENGSVRDHPGAG